MGKTLRNITNNAKRVNLGLGLSRFCIYTTLIFSFFCSIAYAQDGIGQEIPQATIVLKQGATIFSADANFNKQINSDKITVKNAEVSNLASQNDVQVLTAKPDKSKEAEVKTPKKTFKSELKKAEENKNKEDLKKIKKEIADYQKGINPFDSENLRFPTSEEFTSSTSINRDYVTPNYNQHYFSKILVSLNQYTIKSALDFLHQQKFMHYNNKSLDFCFSVVFSVRPPPVLI